MKKNLSIAGALLLVIIIVLAVVITLQVQQPAHKQKVAGISITPVNKPTPHAYTAGMPYVQGDQVVDGSGHPLILRGAQIESAFAYIGSWKQGTRITDVLNSTVFNEMVQDWHMNALRLPLSNWIYALDPASYLSQLDPVIQQANAAGLYVVLDLHDNAKAGSPYGDNADLPKTEDVPFWRAIAAHYKNNPQVMFDLYNEPKATSWSQWLHGGGKVGGATVVGVQRLINFIRSTGAKQIIIVEPGSAGTHSGSKGWSSFGTTTLSDPNIMYSLHVYDGIGFTPQQEDALWGLILHHHPLYYGEWALVTNGPGPAGYDHCKSVPNAQAAQIVTNFLNYMASRQANWTAWQFTPYHLIQDYANFTPTTLDIPWVCGDAAGQAGMGVLVKQFLTS